MAESGNYIKYSSFSNTYSGGSIMDIDSGSGTGNRYVYISAPSWRAQITINKNWGSWGRSFSLTASYWNGTEWVQAWSNSQSYGQWNSGEWSYYYYHNSTKGTTSKDVATAVLWELNFSYPELYRKRFWVYAGGIGCMSETLYNENYQGKKIYSAGNLGEALYKNYGSTKSRDAALALFSQSADSGTKITAENETKLVSYKYC